VRPRALGRAARCGQPAPRIREEDGAGGREPHAAADPVEQGRAELRLQVADLPGERGLGDVQPLRSAAEILLLRGGDEVAQMAELHAAFRLIPGEH
jgi:hypothetical protein